MCSAGKGLHAVCEHRSPISDSASAQSVQGLLCSFIWVHSINWFCKWGKRPLDQTVWMRSLIWAFVANITAWESSCAAHDTLSVMYYYWAGIQQSLHNAQQQLQMPSAICIVYCTVCSCIGFVLIFWLHSKRNCLTSRKHAYIILTPLNPTYI